jgi:excinuclease ABC subunit A
MPSPTRSSASSRAASARKAKGGKGPSSLIIRGARVNNLKNISLELPHNSLIVITGVSGSGKSSLAFDTIYAEGQRRYVESLSAYARQFLERMNKPDVDFIQGIAPAIAIEQKAAARNPRSTVGTTTEVFDYLRLLFARLGRTFCYNDGELVQRDSVRTVIDRLSALDDGTRLLILFPMHDHEGHSVEEELDNLKKQGFIRVLVGSAVFNLEETVSLDAAKTDIMVLVDRVVWKRGGAGRIADSLQTAFTEGDGYVRVRHADTGEEWRFSAAFACSECHQRYQEPEPQLFSFNSPAGACPVCQGFGRTTGIDPQRVIPNNGKSLAEGAVQPWTTPKHGKHQRDLERVAREHGVRLTIPYRDLTPEEQDVVWKGVRGFKGIDGFFAMVEEKNYKMHYRILMARYRGYTTCSACAGTRLRPEALAVRVCGLTLGDMVRTPLDRLEAFFRSAEFTEFESNVGGRILAEIRKRLRILCDIGLGYLTLDRLSHTLSGGEAQRINIATSLGSALVGSMYVLDEPTIGLHPRDNQRLISILSSLRDSGNTLIVVEHDREMMERADLIVDIGPYAGELGGSVVAIGTVAELKRQKHSLTGQMLAGKLAVPTPVRRRKARQHLVVLDARQNNLKGIDVSIPLGVLTCITGVSGSGKSTLVHDIIHSGLQKELGGILDDGVGSFSGFRNARVIKHAELVDQSPIGRTPRSNPITYIKAFDAVRDLFAATAAARVRGLAPGAFSFNVPGGRCDACEGDGVIRVEMQFMADLFLECESCKGTRYKKEVLDIRLNGMNIVDVLNMTVNEALNFFSHAPRVTNKLRVLDAVGLGYMRLGQPATTLSGGEAQRLKLANHLSVNPDGHTLFIFDEPTTGLHLHDIRKLLACFDALIAAGHSVLIIEHHLDVIKCADWVIDLGPEGGEAGGTIVAEGTPEQVARHTSSHTGRYLRSLLAGSA